jgi:hypothetical protein
MNYTLDSFDIDSTGRHIRRYQPYTFTIDETLHGLVTLILAQSSMDRSHFQVSPSQFLSNPVHSSAGTTEDQTAPSFPYDIAGQFGFSSVGH